MFCNFQKWDKIISGRYAEITIWLGDSDGFWMHRRNYKMQNTDKEITDIGVLRRITQSAKKQVVNVDIKEVVL